MIIHDHEGNAIENGSIADNYGQSRGHAPGPLSGARTRYGPGEVSRRLALCGLLIDRRRAVLFALAVPCYGDDARTVGRAIAALGRLQRTHLRLQVLAEFAEPTR